ncbi:MAG: hypothetical protein WB680_13210 [Candidatus Acidiferrales bacterium]
MNVTFQEASATLLSNMQSRPNVRVNTIRTYEMLSRRANAVLGNVSLATFTNKHLKDFVQHLQQEGKAPATIQSHVVFAKSVLSSVVDDNGDMVFALKFNNKFIAAPAVKPKQQKTPVATKEDIERALNCGDEAVARFVTLAAASGMRVSEILGSDTIYNAELGAVQIRRGKTDSSERTIYLTPEFNEWLRVHGGPPVRLSLNSLRNRLRKFGLPACHSYRRFRATHCRRAGMLEEILKNQLGHAVGGDITDRYSKLNEDVEFVRREVERVGIGFAIEA